MAFVQLLHQYKVDLNALTEDKDTALKIALREKCENISQFLLQNGANTDL